MLPVGRHTILLCALALPLRALPVAAQSAAGAIRGRVIDAATQPVPRGSVAVRRGGDTALVGGAAVRADGSFQIEGLPAGRYTVRIRALGWGPLERSGVVLSAERPVADLGALTLSPLVAQLSGQTVTAERAEVQLAPDRNSYAVKNTATASGGTAIDVLRTIPSVEVDGTNNVSLRGNTNVVVQINGRSSPLKGEQLGNFLAQLPSSGVARVEVATNPSAKNDPEGTAGIINIVLNQEADLGLSGGFTAGTGTTGLANVSGNVGKQTGPWTVFSSYSVYRDARTLRGRSERTNLANPVPAFVESSSNGALDILSQSATVRSEYKVTQHDALSADVVVSGGRYPRDNAVSYAELDPARALLGLFDQYSDQHQRNLSQDYAVAYRRTGGPQASVFSTELRFTRNAYGSDNLLSGAVPQADPSAGTIALVPERDVTSSGVPSWVLQSDFTHPFANHTKLEAGIKGTRRTTTNDFTASYLDSTTGAFTPSAARASAFDYREQVGAAYAVLSRTIGRIDAQAGLRAEQAATRLLVGAALPDPVPNRYASLFPSAILSFHPNETRQLKLSYSRRITRPDPFQLSPITYREDARNSYHGNPFLRPEYTDAYELGLQEARGWGSVQLNPYVRRTAHAVRFIRAVDSTGVTVGTFDNVASTLVVGSDLNLTYRYGRLSLFGGGGAFHYTSDANNLPGDLSTRAFSWSARTNATWRLTPTLDGQLFANYRAPTATEGGSQTAFVMTNFALRQKLWGDKGSLTLRVSDPFSLTKFGFRTADGRVIELTERRFGMRGVFLTVSRNFGEQLKLRPRQQEGEPQTGPQPGVP
jgi:outer membrane receptor protein involved in Fe transport